MHLANLTASAAATTQYSEFEIYILRITATSLSANMLNPWKLFQMAVHGLLC